MNKLMLAILVIIATVASADAQVTQQFATKALESPAPIVPAPLVPTVATNVRTALDLHPGCVEFVLIRKAVAIGIPCRLPGGGFDHWFLNSILIDQEMAHVDKNHKSKWRKSPKIIAKIFGDGSHPYRERVKEGGLEADFYYWTDKNIPDYIFALMKEAAQVEMNDGPTAPPYFIKMDVDYGHGVLNFFKQDLKHLVLRKSTKQREIAKMLQRRVQALVQMPIAEAAGKTR